VEVAVERPSSSVLLRAAGVQDSAKVVRARAVARVVEAGAKPCVHALAGSVSVGNNTNITASDCSLVSDMSSPDAFKVGSGGSMANGSGRITAASIITHGGCQGCVEALGNTKLTLTRSTSPTTYAPKTSNPYENLNNWSPPYSGSNQNCPSMPSPRQGGSSVTVSPACFNAMRVGSGTTVDLQPGVYYVQGGNLDVQGNLTCTACGNDNGVSIVLVGRGNSAPGRVDVNAQARIDLHAGKQPSEPRLDGVLIYRHAPDAQPSQNGRGEIDINGGATMKLNGAIVAPTSWVTMAGSGATDPNACNVFIVHSMEFRGNTGLSAEGCHFYGTDAGMPRIPRLVE
jgi:hypothetical protein